jgi:hypothetical protein
MMQYMLGFVISPLGFLEPILLTVGGKVVNYGVL